MGDAAWTALVQEGLLRRCLPAERHPPRRRVPTAARSGVVAGALLVGRDGTTVASHGSMAAGVDAETTAALARPPRACDPGCGRVTPSMQRGVMGELADPAVAPCTGFRLCGRKHAVQSRDAATVYALRVDGGGGAVRPRGRRRGWLRLTPVLQIVAALPYGAVAAVFQHPATLAVAREHVDAFVLRLRS